MYKSKVTNTFNYEPIHNSIILLILYILIIVFGGYLMENILHETEMLSNIILFLIMAAIGCVLFKKSIIKDFKDLSFNFKNHINLFIYSPIISIVVVIISNIIVSLTLEAENSNEDYLNNVMTQNKILFFLVCVILGPIVEELVFRKCIFGLLRRKTYILAHIISALLFGFIHFAGDIIINSNYTQLFNVIPYSLLGLTLSIQYEKSKNIFLPIESHIILNCIACLL